jgi:hypothetical protein
MAALIQDTLRGAVVDSIPFLRGSAVRALADRLPAMAPAERGMIDADLMMLLSLIFMHERLVQRAPAVA